MKIFLIIRFTIIIFLSALVPLIAEEKGSFKLLNLKLFKATNISNLSSMPKNQTMFEIEAIVSLGKWEYYGFSDFWFLDGKMQNLNIDFYKHILKYDIFNNDRLFLVGEIKEPFNYNFTGDLFAGIGTSFNLPIFGKLYGNILYYTGKAKDVNNAKVDLNMPITLQFNWYSKLTDLPYGIYLTHGGWSDIDFYEKRTQTDGSLKTAISYQIYEGLALHKDSYALEVGYKYWKNTWGNYSRSTHSTLIYLVKSI